MVTKLIEFLESPQVSTNIFNGKKIQAQIVKKLKRKRDGTSAKIQNDGLPRKRQENSVVTKEREGQMLSENKEEDVKWGNDYFDVEYHP